MVRGGAEGKKAGQGQEPVAATHSPALHLCGKLPFSSSYFMVKTPRCLLEGGSKLESISSKNSRDTMMKLVVQCLKNPKVMSGRPGIRLH